MMMVIYVFILLLAFVVPKSKLVSFCAILFMFTLYSFAYYEGDLQTYEWVYKDYGTGIKDSSFEPGFTFLIILCKNIGLSFTGFRIVLGIIYVSLLYLGVTSLTEYKALALSLSVIFPFFVFTSVMRSGIACVILLNSYKYIVNSEESKTPKIKYILGVGLATLFHYSSVIMLGVLFIPKSVDLVKTIKYIIITVLLTVLITQTNIVYTIVSMITSRGKTIQWFVDGEGTANFTGVFLILILLLVNFVINNRSLRIISNNDPSIENNNSFDLSVFCFRFSLFIFFIFPLMVLSSPFLRIIYMFMPVIISNGINAAYSMKKESKYNLSLTLQGLVVFGYAVFMILYYSYPYFSSEYYIFKELIATSFVIY